MQHLLAPIIQQLAGREEEQRLRTLRTVVPLDGARINLDGRQVINFASNDYLGLSTHPELKRRAAECVIKYGVGNPSSRLISGNVDLYDVIETKLAKLKGTETALVMPSGYQTNLTVLAALGAVTGSEAGHPAKTLLALDRLSHNSLLMGAQLSGCRWTRFQHNDLLDLEKRLLSDQYKDFSRRWLVTESVFSMDGDQVDMSALCGAARKLRAGLFVDEAHATGVLGQSGMGLTVGQRDVTLAMGTFGKGLGGFGAYIACSQKLREYLINFCAGLIYSTALPPAVLGAIDAALDVVPAMDEARDHLLTQANFVRTRLNSMGFDTATSSTQIIPVVVGSEAKALSLAAHLLEHGIYAPAIRPPTVANESSRVRLSLSASHTQEQINYLIKTMSEWK
jgi:8-amino-7-oxononanoate synthase